MGDPVFFFARTYVGVFVRMLSLLVSFPPSILGIFQMNIYKGADSKTSPSLTLGDIVFAVVYGDPSHHFVQKKPTVILLRKFDLCPLFLCPAAALIRGNRNNCTQFSNNLDWLVSKLERLESSSGMLIIILAQTVPPVKQHCKITYFCQRDITKLSSSFNGNPALLNRDMSLKRYKTDCTACFSNF